MHGPIAALVPSRSLLLVLGVCSVWILLFKKLQQKSGRAKYPLPPGPKGKPIIKNILDLPAEKQWEPVTKWAHKYGDVVYLQAAGNDLIYLSSHKAAVDLLEKRSSLYSDRFLTPMMELMDLGTALAFTRYGDDWRRRRRIFHQEFNSSASQTFRDSQSKHARALVGLLRDKPSSMVKHLSYFSAGVILEAIYGFDIKPLNDTYLEVAEEGIKWLEGCVAGAFLVDILPLLKRVPGWMPGASFKRKAKLWGEGWLDSCVRPFQQVSKSYDEGTAVPSFISSWLSRISDATTVEERKKLTDAIQFAAGSAFIGGYETTSSSLLNFILCMVYNPDVQRRAQQELDEKIGRDRLPDFGDKDSLPYIDALIKELLRWFPILPLGVPHLARTDDEYRNMRIPKGSLVMANIWAMSRNEDEYGPDTESFRPERFLENPNALDPKKYAFGFGRRICPGRYMAENNLFIAICYILHLLWIDKEGPGDPPAPRGVFGLVVHLEPFPCSFRPRFEGAEKLIDTLRMI